MPEVEALAHGAPHPVEVLDEDLHFALVIKAADQKPRPLSGHGDGEAAGQRQGSKDGEEEACAHASILRVNLGQRGSRSAWLCAR